MNSPEKYFFHQSDRRHRMCLAISFSTWLLRPLAYMADSTSFESRMNMRPSLRPLAMGQPFFSMKQPSLLKQTCMPCSTIWPTETKFFVMVGTCKIFFMQVWLPSFSNGTSPMCRMGCGVSSPVSM